MTFTPDPDMIRRKLRAAQMAAASALNNGATEQQVRDAVEQGISEALELRAHMDARREHRAA